MKPKISVAQRVILLALSLCAAGVLLSPLTATAQEGFVIKPDRRASNVTGSRINRSLQRCPAH